MKGRNKAKGNNVNCGQHPLLCRVITEPRRKETLFTSNLQGILRRPTRASSTSIHHPPQSQRKHVSDNYADVEGIRKTDRWPAHKKKPLERFTIMKWAAPQTERGHCVTMCALTSHTSYTSSAKEAYEVTIFPLARTPPVLIMAWEQSGAAVRGCRVTHVG